MVGKEQKVSVIIPCREIDKHTEQCITECLKLDYNNFEILVLPDKKPKSKKHQDRRINIISTGKVKPAVKRNVGMKKSKGTLFAFIDSDAYPRKDWLKNAVKYFKNREIGIVGGPNLTPQNVNFWERVSGHVLGNFLANGFACIRYKVTKNQFVKELPSCNYIAKKDVAVKYDPCFLTAEDSKFCFDVVNKGYKILYAGDVVVYHHRRDSFGGHIKQMFIYGRDISRLSKQEFSFDKLYYSINSIGVLGFILGVVLSVFSPVIRMIFLYILFLYLLIILATSFKENLKMSFCVFITIIATHFVYGFGWLYGMFSEKPVSDKI